MPAADPDMIAAARPTTRSPAVASPDAGDAEGRRFSDAASG
jgi:hypothetical protein